MCLLHLQGKVDCGTRCLEGQETAITRPVDHATARSSCIRGDELSMACDQFSGDLIAKLRLERRRVREVSEYQRQDA